MSVGVVSGSHIGPVTIVGDEFVPALDGGVVGLASRAESEMGRDEEGDALEGHVGGRSKALLGWAEKEGGL